MELNQPKSYKNYKAKHAKTIFLTRSSIFRDFFRKIFDAIFESSQYFI